MGHPPAIVSGRVNAKSFAVTSTSGGEAVAGDGGGTGAGAGAFSAHPTRTDAMSPRQIDRKRIPELSKEPKPRSRPVRRNGRLLEPVARSGHHAGLTPSGRA